MDVSNPAYRHGHAGRNGFSPTYHSWACMVQRCTNPKRVSYKDYGGRGIRVCKRWLKFDNFLADMGERPAGTSLDRRNTNGNYCKSNCRWATNKEQGTNTRANVNVTIHGETLCVAEWARRLGLSLHTVHARIYLYGFTPYDALTQPKQARGSKRASRRGSGRKRRYD